jgi:glutathione synthase/RimK-type ligase-like ATP-grasp enzyme
MLRSNAGELNLNDVEAVWWRRPQLPAASAELTDAAVRNYVEQECRTFTQDVWGFLECRWLPAQPKTVQRAQLKASQLHLAGRLGFELPPTLVTNSPSDFLDFYRQHNGQIISKLLGSAFYSSLGKTFGRYTEVVSARDVAYAHSVQLCPLIFQAYVPKRVELRITVVGREVFAAEIESQGSHHTRHDWRRYDSYSTVYRPHDLPDDIRQRCVRLVHEYGLLYGAVDMVLTPDGRYVFLELNPNGQYLWIEEATGLPISDAICDELLSTAPGSGPFGDALAFAMGGVA